MSSGFGTFMDNSVDDESKTNKNYRSFHILYSFP